MFGIGMVTGVLEYMLYFHTGHNSFQFILLNLSMQFLYEILLDQPCVAVFAYCDESETLLNIILLQYSYHGLVQSVTCRCAYY